LGAPAGHEATGFPNRAPPPEVEGRWQFQRMAERLSPADIAIDCGASDGECTRQLAANGATVYAFEPNPHGFSALRDMFNGSATVHLLEQAVGTETGHAQLHRSGKFSENPDHYVRMSTLIAAEGVFPSGIAVEQIDLIAFITALSRRVAILKMDIEGSEVPILERLLDTRLINRIGSVFVETHERIFPELATRTLALRQRIKRDGIRHITLEWV
jgi:FkbM family methyltransferase